MIKVNADTVGVPLVLLNFVWRRADPFEAGELLMTAGFLPYPKEPEESEVTLYIQSDFFEGLLELKNPLDFSVLFSHKVKKSNALLKQIGGVYTPLIVPAKRAGVECHELMYWACELKQKLGNCVGNPQDEREQGMNYIGLTCYRQYIRDIVKGSAQGCVEGHFTH